MAHVPRFLIGFWCLLGFSASIHAAGWAPQAVKTDADFRGLSVVDAKVVWASGTKGTFVRTTDGGQTWSVGTVPEAEKLDFRDVEAFSDMTAYLLAAGPGGDSRIYKTADGGQTWTMQFKNHDPDAFYDAFAFWDKDHGIALSDPVKGRFPTIVTDDGGATWKRLPEADLPVALPGEGAFAASGSCLVARGKSDAWFATGGTRTARVFRSTDRGRTWSAAETPVTAGVESAGIFSIAFRDATHGLTVGGDYRKPNDAGANAAMTSDGGKTWTACDKLPYQSGAAWAKDRWVTVGTAGSYYSLDDGKSWKFFDKESYNAVAFTAEGAGWAVGPKGRIARYEPNGK